MVIKRPSTKVLMGSNSNSKSGPWNFIVCFMLFFNFHFNTSGNRGHDKTARGITAGRSFILSDVHTNITIIKQSSECGTQSRSEQPQLPQLHSDKSLRHRWLCCFCLYSEICSENNC